MIEINLLDHNGRGIGKLNDKIVFVKNALPGEIIDIKVIKEKKNYIEANGLKYIKKSNIRVDSPCPYFETCGGCDIMHMSYQNQLQFKQNKVENIINKFFGNNVKINEIISSSSEFNYRNKVTFQVNEKIGFYKNKTYEIIEIDKCIISNELINQAIMYLKKLNLSSINKIICRTATNQLMIIILG